MDVTLVPVDKMATSHVQKKPAPKSVGQKMASLAQKVSTANSPKVNVAVLTKAEHASPLIQTTPAPRTSNLSVDVTVKLTTTAATPSVLASPSTTMENVTQPSQPAKT
tara:strand:- start:4608 stop:4931 length:324 start_codon:yes stop_codon:yes gene_type:complete